MNPDLMITIAFSLWAALGSGALAVLFVLSAHNERTEEADTKRFDAAGGTVVAIRQPRPTRAANDSGARALGAGRDGERGVEAKVRAAPRTGAGAGKRWEA
jgi:hypothetical protein